MPLWLIIVLVVLLVLVVGGAIARRQQLARTQGRFDSNLASVNEDLAAAHAADRGWDPERLEQAAERAWTQQRPGVAVRDLSLVQVVDQPGTDEDKAVFRLTAEDREQRMTLGRHAGEWAFERFE